jgi:hypothetical protein
MERFMEEDLALFAAEHASKLGAYCVDVRLEDHDNGLIIVADDKIQRGVINCRREMAQEC